MVPVAVPAVAVAVLTGSVPMYIVGGVLVEPDSSYIPLIYPISPKYIFCSRKSQFTPYGHIM